LLVPRCSLLVAGLGPQPVTSHQQLETVFSQTSNQQRAANFILFPKEIKNDINGILEGLPLQPLEIRFEG
jgi:hypothetical protein